MQQLQKIKRKKLFVGFSTINRPKFQYKLYDTDLIKQDLLNHFNTPKGARVMLPDFGTIIWDLLFEPFDATIKEMIIEDVRRVIASETRVQLISLDVTTGQQGIILDALLNYIPYDTVDQLYINFKRQNNADAVLEIK